RSEVLPALIAGEQTATWAVADATGDWNPDAGLRVSRKDDGFVLSGTKSLVEDADRVDWELVSAVADDGSVQFLIARDTDGVDAHRLDGFDLTRRQCELHFDDVHVPAAARVGDAANTSVTIDRQFWYAAALLTAESIGAMDAVFGITVDYAKVRTAFG